MKLEPMTDVRNRTSRAAGKRSIKEMSAEIGVPTRHLICIVAASKEAPKPVFYQDAARKRNPYYDRSSFLKWWNRLDHAPTQGES